MMSSTSIPRTKGKYWPAGALCLVLAIVGQMILRTSVPLAQPFIPPVARSGIHTVADAIQVPREGIKVYVLYTGDIQVGGKAMLDPKDPRVHPDEMKKQFVPALAYLIRHPSAGDVLFDTGFGPAFVNSPNGDLGWWTWPLVQARVHEGQDLTSQLRRLGVLPSTLKYVVLSHGHVDHTGGLLALGQVTVLMGKGERSAIAQRFALLHGYKQAHFADVSKLLEVDFDSAPELAPLGHAVDLFGDGSIFLLDARGHTPGHLSLLVNLPQGPLMLAGDTVQTHRAFLDAIPSGNSTDLEKAHEAAQRLLTLQTQFPQLRVFYGHDAGQAATALKPPASYQ